MSTVLSRRKASDSGIVVKYSPCAKNEQTDDEDLDEIAIVDSIDKDEGQGSKDLEIVEDGAEPTTTANGPRHLPGLEIYQSPTDRTKLIGERLSSSDKISVSSPIYSNKVVEQKSKSSSKQSLLDLMSHKFDRVKSGKKRFSLATSSLMKASRPSVANVVTSREIRRQRKKDIEEKFGKKSVRNEKIETSTTTSDNDGCNWTFVFDPSGRLCYWWTSVVSVAFLYNFWVIIYRFAFQEINSDNIGLWFTLDYSADFLYILDIAFRFRTGYLEEGVLQTDPVKLRIHYMNTTIFYIDCLCLLPLDFLYLSIGFCSILRFFRLVKVYRYWTFLDRTERHTNYPNVIRTLTLMHYLLALFHWNSCFFYVVATRFEHDPEYWKFPKNANDTHLQYLHALYWSTMTLTTVGNPPNPRTTGEYFFTIFEMIFALLLFATVLGHIANIVTSISAARKEFQAKLDGVKTYMNLRRVPLKLQDRVIKWFDYLWMCNKSSDEDRALSLLPDKLKAEIAIHVHLDTLKRVEIFQQTEAGFLCELVLRLRPVLFSPGDYICRKDEVGKEMYIVNRGRLQVVADNGKTMLATLKPGSYFGEISILNMGTAGNRRTASVRSVGYSDLFCLSKKDLWDVLKEYPAARVKLEAIAVKRLEKYKKAPLEKIALPRSKSTPGLVESAGKIPIQASMVSRHHTLPANMLIQNNGQNDVHMRAECHSEDNLIARCTENTSNSKTVLRNFTTSMTVSSLTSYNEDGSPLHSPNSVNQTKEFQSPPTSPRCVPPVSCTTTVTSSGVPPFLEPFHQHSQYTFPQHFTQSFPFVSPPQMTYLSPYCASPNYPATPNSNMLSTPGMFAQANMNASQTSLLPPYQPSHPTIQHPQQNLPHTSNTGNFLQPPLSPMPTSPMPPSISPISLNSQNPQSEQLLNEIGRLRERLAQLETENSSLTVKLNQQQWDVENRLAELEMHICQSDSVASTGSGGEEKMDKMTPINRESII